MSRYDINHNCATCGQYVYDQHKKSCPDYVEEKLSDFHKRIQSAICGDCLAPIEPNHPCLTAY